MAQVATSTLLLVWMSIVLRYLLIPKVVLLMSAVVTCISILERDCFCFFCILSPEHFCEMKTDVFELFSECVGTYFIL